MASWEAGAGGVLDVRPAVAHRDPTLSYRLEGTHHDHEHHLPPPGRSRRRRHRRLQWHRRGFRRAAGVPGARVVVLARRADRLADLVSRIEQDGGNAVAISVDVTDAVAVQRAADRVEAEFGGADLLLNNAGVMLPAPVEELATDQWKQQIDLNITGLMNAIGAFTPQLVKAAAELGVADLINTSSIAAQNIFPNFAVYSATKAYVTHLSRHLRAELGAKNVRVSALEPGIVGTELQSHVTDQGARTGWPAPRTRWSGSRRRTSRRPSASSPRCRRE